MPLIPQDMKIRLLTKKDNTFPKQNTVDVYQNQHTYTQPSTYNSI